MDDARRRYEAMGDDEAAERANTIATEFTGLETDTIDLLERHVSWQIHACRAVYGSFEGVAARTSESS